MKWVYLCFDLVIGSVGLWASFRYKLNTHIRSRQMIRAFCMVGVPFIVWDVFAAKSGHWSFNDVYTLGVRVLGLPIEELLFFIVVPFACMVVWDGVEKYVEDSGFLSGHMIIACFELFSFVVLITQWEHMYTRVVSLAFLAVCIVLSQWFRAFIMRKRFWIFQLMVLLLFVFGNLILTGLPIVRYGADAITGMRFLTIPFEDFLYNFVLLNLFLIGYRFSSKSMDHVPSE